MAARFTVLVVLALVGLAITVISLLVYLLVARALRIPLVDASIGFGPKVLQTRLLGVPLTVRPFLFGCFVRPWPLQGGVESEHPAALGAKTPEARPLSSRGASLRAAFGLLPFLTVVTLAAIAHRAALPALLAQDGSMLLRGAISPFVQARGALSAATIFGETHGTFALGLRLLPAFALGQLSAVSNLASLVARPGTGAQAALVAAPMLAMFLLMLAWLAAIATWLVA